MSQVPPPTNGPLDPRVEALFAEALELASGERVAHLERASDDPALRREVLDLLASPEPSAEERSP